MPNVTIGYGALLTSVGLGGYLATGAQHKTALIPAGFGALAIALGQHAKKAERPAGALRGAAFVSLLGLAGSARGLKKLPELLRGGEVERPAAVIAQSIMAGASALYLTYSLFSSPPKRR